jgi:hypothetical protein
LLRATPPVIIISGFNAIRFAIDKSLEATEAWIPDAISALSFPFAMFETTSDSAKTVKILLIVKLDAVMLFICQSINL